MSAFSDAFKAARASKGAGKTFTFQGKSYSTDTKEDRAKSVTPPKRPSDLGGTKTASSSETKWADPGAKEGGKPRGEAASASKADKTGWADPGQMGYRKGGAVKAMPMKGGKKMMPPKTDPGMMGRNAGASNPMSKKGKGAMPAFKKGGACK